MSTVQARTPAAATPGLNDDIGEELRLRMFRMQVEIREAEQRAYDLFLQNLVKGTSHLSLGQEAVAVGFAAAMKPGDLSFCTYRGHAHTLARGVPVVTGNKALLAHHGVALAKAAEAKGLALNYEAAVAGGIPIIKTLREGLAGTSVNRVYGILNGTCNYILSRMEQEGLTFAECLKDAQRLGYAEANPSFDVDGHDTAQKLAILASLAFGTRVSQSAIYVEGISSIKPEDLRAAEELGYRVKLLGVAVRTAKGIEQRVHPTMVPKYTAIADVDGVANCVAIDGDFVGDIMLIGPGAGAGPTASSVISDVIDIARGHILPPFVIKAKELKPYKKAQMRAHEGGYYIRLSVYDRTGAFAAIAGRMAEQGISLESIVQRRRSAELPGFRRQDAGAPAAVVMITHQTSEAAIRKALAAIERDGHVDAKPQMIRIEKL